MIDYKQFKIHMIMARKDIAFVAEVLQANGVSKAKIFWWNLRYTLGM